MARKPEPRPLHPLRISEAMEALNAAAFAFCAKVDNAATRLELPSPDPAKVAKDLAASLAEFQAAFWQQDLE